MAVQEDDAKAIVRRKTSKLRAPGSRTTKPAPALRFDTLPSLLGFHMRLANIAMVRDFMLTVQALDLTQRQSAILMLIGANPGTSQIALAEFLSTDGATMMAMIDKLENRKLVSRRPSKDDRRVRHLHLTRQGETMLGELRAKIIEHEAHFKKRFTASELALFMDFLSRVHGKL